MEEKEGIQEVEEKKEKEEVEEKEEEKEELEGEVGQADEKEEEEGEDEEEAKDEEKDEEKGGGRRCDSSTSCLYTPLFREAALAARQAGGANHHSVSPTCLCRSSTSLFIFASHAPPGGLG